MAFGAEGDVVVICAKSDIKPGEETVMVTGSPGVGEAVDLKLAVVEIIPALIFTWSAGIVTYARLDERIKTVMS